ncbi:MAG: sulfotransferase [Synechococcaceae cyanobacterium ELA182]
MQLFLGIGAQKSGTTWVYHQLKRHPQVLFPGGKEFHFWDLLPDMPATHWLEHLSPPSISECSGATHCGEITPSYALLPPETIATIKQACPDLKVFIVLRNPIERAWSAALMALDRSQMTLDEASDQWFIDHMLSRASRSRGDYLSAIRTWQKHFGSDQFDVLFYDQLAEAPDAFLRQLSKHLGIDGTFFTSIPVDELSMPVVPTLSSQQRITPIHRKLNHLAERPKVLRELHRLYDDPILALQEHLQIPLDHWIQRDPADREPIREALEVAIGGSGFALVSQLLRS